MCSASFATGAVRTTTPRSPWTAHGKTFEVNSMSGNSTVAPAGRAEAIGASICDTCEPMATSASGTPIRRAKDARARFTGASHDSQLVLPRRQSASASCRASQAGLGGRP
jgi:hypothetical protein